MGAYTDGYVATLRRSLADGLVACAAPVDSVIDILAGLLASPDDAWPLLAPLAGAGADEGTTTAERERFAAGLRAAVADGIRPAFARLHDALASEIRPAARPPERPGLCHIPGGDLAYRRLVRVHTSLEVPPDELHRIGLAEIERIDAELERLAGRTIGSRTLEGAIDALRGDPALHFATRDEVFAKAASSLARAAEASPAWFGRLPQAPCVVVRMGPYEEEHSTIAYYRAAGGRRLPARPLLHQHHARPRPGPATRRRSSPTTSRSRATTCRSPSPRSWPACPRSAATSGPRRSSRAGPCTPSAWPTRWASTRATSTASGCCRSTRGAPRAWWSTRACTPSAGPATQAIDYMLEHTALAPNNIENEVDRYIVARPGPGLQDRPAEILRLRAGARARLGPVFDIRAFHDAVLGDGAVALPTLRGVVDAWVTRSIGHASPA